MKRFRKAEPPGWLGPVAKAVGMKCVEVITPPLKRFHFSNMVKPDDPVLTGMVIGHWNVGERVYEGTSRGVKRSKTFHLCASKCGVIAAYEPWEIAAGRLPNTCYGCRAGEGAPPVSRIILENELARHVKYWTEDYIMATAFEEKSDLDNKDGQILWMEQGRPVMQEIVNRTSFGSAFGWKVHVLKLQDLRHARPKTHRVRIMAIHKADMKFEMFIQHAGSPAGFAVYLMTGRTDHKFPVIVAEVERAVKILQSLDTGENHPAELSVGKVTAAASVPAESNGHVGAIDLAKLMKLKGGIETLMSVGKDYNELVDLKAKARKRVEAANARKGDLHVAKIKSQEAVNATALKMTAAKERVATIEMQLRNALAVCSNLEAEVKKAIDAAAAAREAYEPAEKEAADAEKELAELDALESERLKSVGDVKGLANLLDALSRIG